jgi:hypothetical protein
MDLLQGLSLAFGPSVPTSSRPSGKFESKRSTAPKPPPLPPRPNLDTYAKQRLEAERAMYEKRRKELEKIEKENKKAIEKQMKANKKMLEKQRKDAEKKLKDDARKQKHDLEKVAKEQAKKMQKQKEEAEIAAAKQRALYANAVFVDTNAMVQAQRIQEQQRMQQAQIPMQPPNLFTAGPLQQYHVAEWNIMQQRWEYRGVSGRDVVEYGVNPSTRKWHRMQPLGPALDGTPFRH